MAVAPELLGGLVQDDLAVGEEVAAVCHLERQVDVLLDEENRTARLPGVVADGGQQALDDDRGEPERELVERVWDPSLCRMKSTSSQATARLTVMTAAET
jgi:hypothetical protein